MIRIETLVENFIIFKINYSGYHNDVNLKFRKGSRSLKQFLDLSKLEYLNIERRTSDQDCFIANISKAQNILNWSPKVTLREGLEKSRNLMTVRISQDLG